MDVSHAGFLLTFAVQEVHGCDKEKKTAGDVLEMGENIAENCGSHYMRCLFSLSRAQVSFGFHWLFGTTSIK